ncbi:hypothetical protein [Nonomuraea africana]|uniref:RCK C-terminal domain-containing protein n=1 Tax=Nonomuraea africana TaxID=46171 RepID=A0ABR9KCS9_9ACTN|nr:hypothetical protein [Nonomuraea africana]MBE1559814.1 hypothetical protein [Nonomuraea africana]
MLEVDHFNQICEVDVLRDLARVPAVGDEVVSAADPVGDAEALSAIEDDVLYLVAIGRAPEHHATSLRESDYLHESGYSGNESGGRSADTQTGAEVHGPA